METLIAIFNFVCWLVGLPVVVAAMIAVIYELFLLISEGLRAKLRKNKRFITWLNAK